MTLLMEPQSRVFVLTGAGISAESGIATFRDAGGLWEKHRVEDVASPEGFARDPELVWRFYAQRRAQAKTVAPNRAHNALARLAERLGERLYICTQNVDDLHERARESLRDDEARGSGAQPHQARRSMLSVLSHIHGELFQTRCSDPTCKTLPFVDARTVFEDLPRCSCGALQRPHIVWFGEVPFALHEAKRAVQACDVFLTVGSSGAVYPAAGLVREMRYRQEQGERCRSVYIGLERPDNAESFDEIHLGKAGEVLPALLG